MGQAGRSLYLPGALSSGAARAPVGKGPPVVADRGVVRGHGHTGLRPLAEQIGPGWAGPEHAQRAILLLDAASYLQPGAYLLHRSGPYRLARTWVGRAVVARLRGPGQAQARTGTG